MKLSLTKIEKFSLCSNKINFDQADTVTETSTKIDNLYTLFKDNYSLTSFYCAPFKHYRNLFTQHAQIMQSITIRNCKLLDERHFHHTKAIVDD